VNGKLKTLDFGAPDEYGAHVFRVEIPTARREPVRIIEDYGLKGGEGSLPYEELRAVVDRPLWSAIAEAARRDFNERLKVKKLPPSRWKIGVNRVDRLLGKELCVLAWAAERATVEECPILCGKWGALRPEERWWLFAMTATEAGLADDSERGWRKALYFALADGKVGEKPPKRRRLLLDEEWPVLSLFD